MAYKDIRAMANSQEKAVKLNKAFKVQVQRILANYPQVKTHFIFSQMFSARNASHKSSNCHHQINFSAQLELMSIN